MIFEWLTHKMVDRNVRLVRSGLKYRVWFIAFWISLAAFAVTEQKWLEFTTLALLICAVIARILARLRARQDLEKIIQDEQKRSS